jgi:hypothetical protein
MGIGMLLLVILAGVAIGVSAYHAGQTNGLEQAGRSVEVVRVYRPVGFFPFGLILFPLFFFGIIALLRAAAWRRWGGPGHGWGGPGHKGGPGPFGEHASSRFEEWHRRQHEANPPPGGDAGGQTSTV